MEEAIFEVGLALSIANKVGLYVTTNVLGWDEGVYLLTRAIYGRDQPAELKSKQLRSKDVCKIRFLKDGAAYGFETVVLFVQFLPVPIMFLKYPEHVERVELRRTPRCKLSVPVRLWDVSGMDISGAVMHDLSEGGCLLEMPSLSGKELSIEATYTVSFLLMDKAFLIDCVIKKLREGPEGWSVGFAFKDVAEHHREALGKVIEFVRQSSG